MDDIEKIKQILENHERRISKLEEKNSISTKKTVGVDSVRALTDLLKESFFIQPKKYGQIIKQLKTNATYSVQSNYRIGLETLVKQKKLSRKMVDHQWEYKNG